MISTHFFKNVYKDIQVWDLELIYSKQVNAEINRIHKLE